MKLILAFLFVGFFSLNLWAGDDQFFESELVTEVTCDSGKPIKEHMINLGQLMQIIEVYSDTVFKEKNTKADDMHFYQSILRFRYNLHAVFVKTPEKLHNVPLSRRVIARRFFQKSIATLIVKTVEVEEILFRRNLDAYAQKEQRVDLVKVLMSMKKIIDTAHKTFRD